MPTFAHLHKVDLNPTKAPGRQRNQSRNRVNRGDLSYQQANLKWLNTSDAEQSENMQEAV